MSKIEGLTKLANNLYDQLSDIKGEEFANNHFKLNLDPENRARSFDLLTPHQKGANTRAARRIITMANSAVLSSGIYVPPTPPTPEPIEDRQLQDGEVTYIDFFKPDTNGPNTNIVGAGSTPAQEPVNSVNWDWFFKAPKDHTPSILDWINTPINELKKEQDRPFDWSNNKDRDTHLVGEPDPQVKEDLTFPFVDPDLNGEDWTMDPIGAPQPKDMPAYKDDLDMPIWVNHPMVENISSSNAQVQTENPISNPEPFVKIIEPNKLKKSLGISNRIRRTSTRLYLAANGIIAGLLERKGNHDNNKNSEPNSKREAIIIGLGIAALVGVSAIVISKLGSSINFSNKASSVDITTPTGTTFPTPTSSTVLTGVTAPIPSSSTVNTVKDTVPIVNPPKIVTKEIDDVVNIAGGGINPTGSNPPKIDKTTLDIVKDNFFNIDPNSHYQIKPGTSIINALDQIGLQNPDRTYFNAVNNPLVEDQLKNLGFINIKGMGWGPTLNTTPEQFSKGIDIIIKAGQDLPVTA